MSINFPTNLDTLSNPSAGDLLENATTVLDHDQQHSNANDAIEALEAKVGANSSAVTTSHDYKLGEVTGTDKAVGKTATQTMTNKTLTSPAINLSSNATGDIYYRDSGGTFQRLPIGTSTQILQVSSGGIPEWITNSNATAPNYFTAVADENITIGQPVGISNYVTGLKVARALRTTTTATLSFTSAEQQNYQIRHCAIGGDKFVFLNTQTSDDSLYATVGSINTSTKTVTIGTSVAVTADITASTSFCVCKLDTDKFIVFYAEDASATIVKYRVGTVSGTTITFGSATTFATSATNLQGVMACEQISTDKGIMVYLSTTQTDARAIAFTTSGTVATAGTPSAIGTTLDDGADIIIRKCGTDKFALVSSTRIQIGTLSGTTITLGTDTAYGSATTTAMYYNEVKSPATDVLVIHYNKSSVMYAIACTISGTTPTFGSELNTTLTGNSNNGMYIESSTVTLHSTNASSGKMVKITRSGTTLTLSGVIIETIASSAPEKLLGMDNGYVIGINVNSTTLSIFIQGMANNFVGIAQGTVSKGGSVVVITGGIDSNQSGLIPGAQYLVSSTGLTFSSNIATVNSVDDKYVLALSATQILI